MLLMNDTVVSVWLMNAGGCCGGVGVDESGKWESGKVVSGKVVSGKW